MEIRSSRWPLTIRLWIPKGNRRLPIAKVNFLLSLVRLFYRCLEFALEVQACQITSHWRDQRIIFSVGWRQILRWNSHSGMIYAKGRKSDSPMAKRVEKKLCITTSQACLRNPKWIIRTSIGVEHFLI